MGEIMKEALTNVSPHKRRKPSRPYNDHASRFIQNDETELTYLPI